MSEVVKDVGHGALESGFVIFESEGHNSIGKCVPRCGKHNFILIDMVDLNLIIVDESVHKREYLMPNTFIDDLANEWGGEVSFGTILV
jgi:hypothetical protein